MKFQDMEPYGRSPWLSAKAGKKKLVWRPQISKDLEDLEAPVREQSR